MKNLKLRIYELTDSFLVEAKDQNGKERSLKQLNQDRHLFVENMLKEIKELLEGIVPDEKSDTWHHCREEIKEKIQEALK